LEGFNGDGLKLTSLSNRGVKVYPHGFEETFCTDHWRAGFMSDKDNTPVTHQQIVSLLDRLGKSGLDFIKIENLYTFDGQKGYVASQGE
jgi:isocitrate dehydrogenase